MNVIEDFLKNRLSFTSTTFHNNEVIYRSINTFEADMYYFDLYKKLIPLFFIIYLVILRERGIPCLLLMSIYFFLMI